jgi:hypothetical protein
MTPRRKIVKKTWYKTNWGRKKEIKMTEQHFEGDDPNTTAPPEEGDDQLVKEGAEVVAPSEDELEDAPEQKDSEGDAV